MNLIFNAIALWVNIYNIRDLSNKILQGRRGYDRMVVGYTTTYAISAYHH